ncbi:MAG: 2-C-methyl-D-erythritol 4-phosphate cytidylyltransferase [Bacteroidota bacterium]
MKRAVVIVAGGSGSRMHSNIPKQFLPLGGKPLLFYTLEAFHQYDTQLPIWLVLPETEHSRWTSLCKEFHCKIPHQVVAGGNCRSQSVKYGVYQIQFEDCVVAIHDGARPLLTHRIIENTFEVAAQEGSAIASVPLKDSIREIVEEDSIAKNRANYRLMQTPQTFHKSWLTEAYERLDAIDGFSDEASLVEAVGKTVTLVEGDYRNIKVTTPEDMVVAEAFIQQKTSD